MNNLLKPWLTTAARKLRSRSKVACQVVCLLATLLVGCGRTKPIEAPTEILIPRAEVGQTVEGKLLIRHHGNSQLSFFKFDIDLSHDYTLDWCKVNTQTGELVGPPRIAGYFKGREGFPKMLDLLPGQDLLLMLKYTSTDGSEPQGRIAMDSNDPANPHLEIFVRPSPQSGQ